MCGPGLDREKKKKKENFHVTAQEIQIMSID